MRWFTWLMPVLGAVVLVVGNVLRIPNTFQASTGWIGLFVFLAAFFVLLGMERLTDELR
jgi:hypothetical protein